MKTDPYKWLSWLIVLTNFFTLYASFQILKENFIDRQIMAGLALIFLFPISFMSNLSLIPAINYLLKRFKNIVKIKNIFLWSLIPEIIALLILFEAVRDNINEPKYNYQKNK